MWLGGDACKDLTAHQAWHGTTTACQAKHTHSHHPQGKQGQQHNGISKRCLEIQYYQKRFFCLCPLRLSIEENKVKSGKSQAES